MRRAVAMRMPAVSYQLSAILLELEFFVDDAFEGFERLRAGEDAAVDEERRRARYAGGVAVLDVGIDDALVFGGVDAGVEAAGVKAQLGGGLLQIGGPGLARVREQPIGGLPEFALFV